MDGRFLGGVGGMWHKSGIKEGRAAGDTVDWLRECSGHRN